MSRSPPQLDYAPPPSAVHRRVRQAARILGLMVLVVAGVIWGPAVWRSAQFYYWQQKCLTHLVPAGTLVCEEPARWGGVSPAFTVAATDAEALTNYLEWVAPMSAAGESGPVLFMHERTTINGQRRLVIVRRIPPANRSGWDAPPTFSVTLVTPTGFWGWPIATVRHQEGPFASFVGRDGDDDRRLRFFGGRPDPADRSRFYIAYELDGEQGEMVGVLQDSGPREADGTTPEPQVDLSGPP